MWVMTKQEETQHRLLVRNKKRSRDRRKMGVVVVVAEKNGLIPPTPVLSADSRKRESIGQTIPVGGVRSSIFLA